MKRYVLNLLLAFLLCVLGDVFLQGLVFFAALLLTMPKRDLPEPWIIPVGAFVSSCIAILCPESRVMFWELFIFGIVSLSLYSMPKAAALAAFAVTALELQTEAGIYVPVFFAVLYNGIFLFTFEKKRGIL